MPRCECGLEQEAGRFCQDCGQEFDVASGEGELVIGLYDTYTAREMQEVYEKQASLSESQWRALSRWAENRGVDVRVRIDNEENVTVLGLAQHDSPEEQDLEDEEDE